MDPIRLAKRLIAFDTMPGTGNEHACQSFLADMLHQGGFQVAVDSFASGRANLYAWVRTRPAEPSLCLAGHIDTVALYQGRWASPPLIGEEREGRLYGRGACDMKSGVAAMICAALAHRPRLLPGQDLRIHIYGGEECGCLGSTEMVRRHPEQLRDVGAVLVAEPTSVRPCVGHKGALWLKVTVSGRAAHGSMPQFGDNALSKTLAVAGRIEALGLNGPSHPVMGASTLTLTTMHSGTSHNSVPDTASFTLDIRTVPGQDAQGLTADIAELAGPDCSVEVLQCIPPLWTDPRTPWVSRVNSLTRGVLGSLDADPAVVQFFTDGAALRPALPEVPIVILGPGEPHLAHQTNEWCGLDQICRAEAVYRAILDDWYRNGAAAREE